MGVAIPIGIILAALGYWLASKKTGVTPVVAPTGALPKSVEDTLANPHASRVMLETAADAAYGSGYTKTADEIMARAAKAPDRIRALKSPWPDVSHTAWSKFAQAMVAAPETFDARGHYGMFLFGVRRLCDLGLMTAPKKQPDGTWSGTWKAGAKQKFLGSGQLQIASLARCMADHRKQISKKYPQLVGKSVDGKPATLSGLLAIAHHAGLSGMEKYINGALRKAAATAAFAKTNGIF